MLSNAIPPINKAIYFVTFFIVVFILISCTIF